MGLELKSPLVVSACPLSEKIDNIVRMEDMGAGAVVLFSLFEEQIKKEAAEIEKIMDSTSEIFSETSGYFPDLGDYRVGSDKYLDIITNAKKRVEIPIIASLNGISNEGWIEYAHLMEQAGADGIEINVYFIPGDFEMNSEEIEQRYLHIVRHVTSVVEIPVAVKLNPYFSSMGNMALKLQKAGAESLVLFNRFYQPDFDINQLKVLSNLEYSVANELRLPLLWISMLYDKIKISLAATTGVQSATEVIKYLLAGADIAMTASALYKNGINHIDTICRDLENWMGYMGFESIDDFKGIMSQKNIDDPTAFERANYIKILSEA